jgi:hypothetical protein
MYTYSLFVLKSMYAYSCLMSKKYVHIYTQPRVSSQAEKKYAHIIVERVYMYTYPFLK